MRVAFICDRPELGGAEISVLEYLKHLPSFGIEPILVTTRESPLLEHARQLNAECVVISAPDLVEYELKTNVLKATRNPFKWARYMVDAAATVGRLGEVLRATGVDIIDTSTLRAHLYGRMVAFRTGLPIVWHMRDIIQKRWLLRIMRTLARNVRILAVSAAASRPFHGLDVQVLPNTIDIGALEMPSEAEMATLRKRWGIERAFPVVCFVGQIVAWKGHDDFIDAAAIVRQRFPAARFLLIGDTLMNDPSYKVALLERVRRLDLETIVKFTGFLDRSESLMGILDILVNASWNEPRGRTILEAMALGKVVIATAAGGSVELVKDGVTGVLIPPHRPTALADAIIRISESDTLRHSLGSTAQALVRATNNISTEMASVAAIYRRVCVAGGASASN
jgi:glycosyltransferase involved in cell wall biosynthesis